MHQNNYQGSRDRSSSITNVQGYSYAQQPYHYESTASRRSSMPRADGYNPYDSFQQPPDYNYRGMGNPAQTSLYPPLSTLDPPCPPPPAVSVYPPQPPQYAQRESTTTASMRSSMSEDLPYLAGGFEPIENAQGSARNVLAHDASSRTSLDFEQGRSLSSIVELRFRCKGLKKADLLSDSDPFVVVYMQDNSFRSWREIGRTETVSNTCNPSFTSAFQVEFRFEEVQLLRLEVFDRDSSSERLKDHDFLGCVELTMGQLMSAKGQSISLALLQRENQRKVSGIKGHIIISGEEVSTCSDYVKIQFTGQKLDNKDGIFGKSDPFINIYRLREPDRDPTDMSSWLHVWRSEVVMNNLNPTWKERDLSVQMLCNGDVNRLLRIECMDWEKNGKHQFIGSTVLTCKELVHGEKRHMDLINKERQRKKGKKYVNSGVLRVSRCEFFKQHTLAEYLRGGMELSLIVGIDYTASNGSPSDPASLHYISNPFLDQRYNNATASVMGSMNAYQSAIAATGRILEPYDSDRRFPVYGFGGLVNGETNHCFPLTFDPSQPEVEGLRGIMQAYAQSFQFVRLHGPTYFAPIVRQAAAIAHKFGSKSETLKYFVLLLLTDGAIMDVQPTINALVDASILPLSIVIVGVGDADFSAMNVLDADDKVLRKTDGQPAARDIVQFVPFNRYRNDPARLAKETLAEIPTQVSLYFKMKHINPGVPLSRPSSADMSFHSSQMDMSFSGSNRL